MLLLLLACEVRDPEVVLWADLARRPAPEPTCAVSMEMCGVPDGSGCLTCACLTAVCRSDETIRIAHRRVCYGCPEAPGRWVERMGVDDER